MRGPCLICGPSCGNRRCSLGSQVFAQNQPITFAGSIHGLVLAEVLESGAPVDFSMPNANVKVRDASGAVVEQASTNLAGIFASPVLPAGVYHVCASAPGFSESCASELTTLVNASVALHQPLVLTAQGGTLHGRVTLKDGSPAARTATAARNHRRGGSGQPRRRQRPCAGRPGQRQYVRRLCARARGGGHEI